MMERGPASGLEYKREWNTNSFIGGVPGADGVSGSRRRPRCVGGVRGTLAASQARMALTARSAHRECRLRRRPVGGGRGSVSGSVASQGLTASEMLAARSARRGRPEGLWRPCRQRVNSGVPCANGVGRVYGVWGSTAASGTLRRRPRRG
ncbi:hypothetical protein P7K49_017297 [Saguinus oedipus]|uniref:Uncharacterized protein n=1 Tax=Saguinus oedipus TaxID=9490 RepID=A0ABQ9V2I4_SAGOE|nr:hypothetical protein P7K49_017297 [Saguinus oedipus]